MSPETRGPRTGRVPPHLRDRLQEKQERERRRELDGPLARRWWAIAGYVVVALLVGLAVGRGTASDPLAAVLPVLRDQVAPAGFQADGIWTLGVGGNPPVRDGLDQLAGGDPSLVRQSADAWLEAYDTAIADLRELTVPVAGEGVRSLFLDAARVSRDAVQVLARAAEEEGPLREVLITEARRLRTRSEGMLRAAEGAVSRLEAHVSGEPAPPGPDTVVPSPLPELRATPAPAGSPTDGGQAGGGAEQPSPTTSP